MTETAVMSGVNPIMQAARSRPVFHPHGHDCWLQLHAEEQVAPRPALRALGEAERVVERERGGVVLVRVELDPAAAARPCALERERGERPPDARAARGLADE